jgi:hypothetical protein
MSASVIRRGQKIAWWRVTASPNPPYNDRIVIAEKAPMPKAYFVVRATVADPSKRAAFDAWYSSEHLPDAVKSFGAEKAWRFWSLSEPSLHQATYQFADQSALDRAMQGADLKRLVADFNRDWPDITRTRDLLVLAEEFGTG